jgi:hypothetical protein
MHVSHLVFMDVTFLLVKLYNIFLILQMSDYLCVNMFITLP